MNIEKFIETLKKDTETFNVSTDQVIAIISSLFEVLHKNGLDNEATEVLSACGIKYEYEVE